MKRPYRPRIRLSLAPLVEAMTPGDRILLQAANGSVKSIVSRWRCQKGNRRMKFRTAKVPNGTIVERLR